MSGDDLPDIECPWCDCADTLVEMIGLEARVFECSCCSMRCYVDHSGRVHKVAQRKSDYIEDEMYRA